MLPEFPPFAKNAEDGEPTVILGADCRREHLSARASSLRGFGVFQRFVEGLAGARGGLHEAPAVVIVAKDGSGAVVDAAGIEHGSDLVQGDPAPSEFYVGYIALPGDAGDGDQLAAGGGNAERLLLGVAGSNETLQRIHTCGCEHYIPAWRRS